MSYVPDLSGFRNASPVDGVAVSSTPTRLGTASKRAAILIANPSASVDVFLKFTKAGTPAPTITSTNWHYPVYAQDLTPFLGLSESVVIWAYSSSPTTVNLVEMGY